MLTATLLLAIQAAPQDLLVELRRMAPLISSESTFTVRAAATLDSDGDGDLDVFFASTPPPPGTPKLEPLLENLGAGLFERALDAVADVVCAPMDVGTGDLDGDGDTDVLVINEIQPTRALENQGGTFTHAGDLADPSPAVTAGVLGDLDLDGDLDLFVARRGGFDGQDRIYVNAGSGFAFIWDPQALPVAVDFSRDVNLGDLDQDGDLDAYVSNESSVVGPNVHDDVLRNLGNGQFMLAAALGHSSETASLADLDGDGDLDAYAGSRFGDKLVWNLGGLGAWASSPSLFDQWSCRVLATDLGGDGIADLMVAPGQRIARGTGGGAFVETSDVDLPDGPLPWATPFSSYPLWPFALGDFDGDLDPDILWPWNEPALWLNDGGSFGAFQTNPIFAKPGIMALSSGDVDGDGHLDLVSAGESLYSLYPGYSGMTWLGDGAGSFAKGAPAFLDPHPSAAIQDVELGDLDGDGDLDAMLLDQAGGSIQRNDGTGGFSEVTGGLALPPTYMGRVELADVDGDGDLDGAMASGGWGVSGALHLLLGAGNATFTYALLASDVLLPFPYIDVGYPVFGDTDGDGDQDLLWTRTYGPTTLLFENDGAGAFLDISAGHLPPLQSTGAVEGDVDGDGDLDVVLQLPTGADLVLVNDGSGVFSPGTSILPPGYPTGLMLLGDGDGDGAPDLIDVRLENMLYPGDGAGGFKAGSPFGEVLAAQMKWVDVDGDRDPDLVGNAGRPVVYTNVRGGQVAWRSLPRAGKPLRMEIFGQAGTPWALAASPGTASVPLGSFGTLLLNPGALWVLAGGALPADGMAGVNVPVPNDPTLVGQTVYWQALTGSPLSFTNREATAITAY